MISCEENLLCFISFEHIFLIEIFKCHFLCLCLCMSGVVRYKVNLEIR